MSILFDEYHERHMTRGALCTQDMKVRLRAAQLPAREKDASVVKLTADQREIYEHMVKIVASSPPAHAKFGRGIKVESKHHIVIAGAGGTGKTYAACATLQQLIKDNELSGHFVSAARLFDMFTDAERNNGDLPEGYLDPQLLRFIKDRFDILVIDDLGAEHLTEFRISSFRSLLTQRYDEMMPVVVTTSLSADEITAKYGERTALLLNSRADTFVLAEQI